MDDKRTLRRAYELREKMVALPPPLVLVAEDDDDVRSMVAAVLRHEGCSVIEAGDGAELVEHIGSALLFGNLRGDLDPIALVISDIRMPGQSGLDILATLRRSDICASIILMTAYADGPTRARAERLGADALLAKPFEIDELRRLVRRFLPPAPPLHAGDSRPDYT